MLRKPGEVNKKSLKSALSPAEKFGMPEYQQATKGGQVVHLLTKAINTLSVRLVNG